MTLITLLLALALERFLGYMSDFRNPRGLTLYVDRLGVLLDFMRLRHPGLRLLFMALPLVLIVGGLAHWFSQVLLGLPGLIFGVAVVLYCLGPEDLEEEINNYVEAVATGDDLRQRKIAFRLLGEPPSEKAVERARQVALAGFSESNNRLFAVIFWFALMGPAAAVLYRLVAGLAGRLDQDQVEESQDDKEATGESDASQSLVSVAIVASGLAGLMEWIPARLAALGYAVTGSFDPALISLRDCFWGDLGNMRKSSCRLLAESGSAAVRLEDLLEAEVDAETTADASTLSAVFAAVTNHIQRNLIVRVTVIALMTLGGWSS